MILKLILDKENSLLYESTALEEVEDFLINAARTLTPEELKELQKFIQEAPEQNNVGKGLSDRERKRFLELIEGKAEPVGHTLYEIKSGFVGPVMDEASFAALSNGDIINRLVNKREWFESESRFTDITQDWQSFIPKYPQRAWEILQESQLFNNNALWEKSAWALASRQQEITDKNELFDFYKAQWNAFSIPQGFFDEYINKKLNPSPLVDWLNQVASYLRPDDETYLSYWSKLWDFSKDWKIYESKIYQGKQEYKSDYLSSAINDPRGKLAEGLLDALYRHKPERDSGIPPKLRTKFNQIFTTDTEVGWLAQVVFARHVRNLFVIDPAWTEKHLLTAFDYNENEERATRLWTGFLYNPNVDLDTFEKLKPLLLGLIYKWDTMFPSSISSVDGLRRNLIHLLTYTKINYPETVTNKEFTTFFQELKIEDLENLFSLFHQLLVEPLQKEKDDIFWKETLEPFFEAFWPGDKRSSVITINFLDLAVRCPKALVLIKDYLLKKPFLTKGDFTHSSVIYSLSKSEVEKDDAVPYMTLENAQAFFDLFEKVFDFNSKSPNEYMAFYGIDDVIKKFLATFPKLVEYPSFKKIQVRFL